MSIHVCKCTHNGREEWHLRYPGMTESAAQELADKINASQICAAKEAEQAVREACAKSVETYLVKQIGYHYGAGDAVRSNAGDKL